MRIESSLVIFRVPHTRNIGGELYDHSDLGAEVKTRGTKWHMTHCQRGKTARMLTDRMTQSLQ